MSDTPQKDIPLTDTVFGHLVSRDPLIVWGPSNPPYWAGPGTQLAPHIGNCRAYFLISPAWTRESDHLVRTDIEHIASLRAQYPDHRHVVLCNMTAELERYRAEHQPAIVCNANVFVDETKFDIPIERTGEFDAVYNAQLVPFKRHELCRDIESLALIYHRFAMNAAPADYPDRVKAMLPNAVFVNEIDGAFRYLSEREVVSWLGRAGVGLCLSETEGQMRACAEYLLCGLPVVTTPNKGGRDRILHPAYAIEVPPDPKAVATAVRTLKSRNLDPQRIRRAVCQRLKPDRERLLRLIAGIFAAEGKPFPENADWRQLFRRGTWPVRTSAALFAEPAVSETNARDAGAP
jgi:glycosyltransferase involved in cell wall biosynthesis